MDKEKHYNTTIMFIDMAGYTSKTSKLSRAELKETLEEFEEVVKPVIKNFGGRVIKGMGDAYLITFHSPTNSLLASNEIQKRIKDRNESVDSEKRFEARIGLSSGEVYERGGDVFGTPVNLAARIQSKGKPGQILFGSSVYHAMNKNEIGYYPIGKYSLKGIDEKVQIYKVHKKKRGMGGFFGGIKRFFSKYKWWILALFIFLILVGNTDNQNQQEEIEREVILNQEWFELGQQILEENNNMDGKFEIVEELINKYEQATEEEKTLGANIFAAIFYALLERPRESLDAIRISWEQAEFPAEKRHVIDIAHNVAGAYPEESIEREEIIRFIERNELR